MPPHPDVAIRKPHRFYTRAEAAAAEGGFALRLDGRGARTPAGAALVLPTAALGARVAAEWAGQGEEIDAAAMPLTRLAATALDRAPEARAGLAAEVTRWAASDLLCYFADAPAELVARQVRAWEPMLDWADRDLGLTFERAQGVVHRPQPPETLARVATLSAALDDFALTGLAFAAALFGSAVLALALQRGTLSGEAALDLSRLDETFQEERWGVDEEAAARAAALRREAVMIGGWFADLR